MVWERTNNAGDTDIMAQIINPTGPMSNYAVVPGTPFAIWDQGDDSYDAHVVTLALRQLRGRGPMSSTARPPTSISAVRSTARPARCWPRSLRAFTATREEDLSIAALKNGGGFVVTWTQTNASNNGDILFRIFSSTGALGHQRHGCRRRRGAGRQHGDRDQGRRFEVTWTDLTGHVWMQGYAADGSPAGDPLVIAEGAIASAKCR